MDEETKDKIEFRAAIAVQTVISAVPFVGGPIATAFGHAISKAQQDRTQRLLDEILRDLERLAVHAEEPNIEGVLKSDQFIANLTTTIRGMQETADQERIDYLRGALVAGVKKKWRSDSEPFLHSAIRLTKMHIAVLEAIVELADHRARTVRGGTVAVRDQLSTMRKRRSESHVAHLGDELAAEGYLIMGKPRTGPEGQDGRAVRLTYQGLNFFNFLNDGDASV